MNAFLIWITGLSGAGKTTIGRGVYEKIKDDLPGTVFLDGDTFRQVLGSDLGHDFSDRLFNAFRISRMCKFLVDQGINVICSTMSLYKEIHQFNRENFSNYYEVFLDVSMEELIKRDKNNLYSRALTGQMKDIVGIDLPYDRPENCDLIVDNNSGEVMTNVSQIINLLKREQCVEIR